MSISDAATSQLIRTNPRISHWIHSCRLHLSPITRVKFGVTDTRVDNVTNYDRLTLEVWTDGSLGPDEAVTSAAEILINYLALFKTTNVPKSRGAKKVANPMRKERNRPCSRCPLTIWTSPSVPTIASDGRHQHGRGYHQQDGRRLICVRNLGSKSLEEVKNKIEELGLHLRSSDEE